jgi:hypothetical protein
VPNDYHNTGPRRLCPICLKSISTTRGKFDAHTMPGKPHQQCAGSGQKVSKASDALQAPLPCEVAY